MIMGARLHGCTAARLHGCMGAWQVLIGPHGGNLQNMVFMRQPGTEGVADWTSDSTCVQPELFRVVLCVCVGPQAVVVHTLGRGPGPRAQGPGPSGTCVVKRTLPVTVWLCLVIGLGLPA